MTDAMVIRRLIAPNIDFSALRRELKLPTQFSPAAQREADHVAASGPIMPSTDHTDIAFVTLDPPTSMDLDQAMCLQRRPKGYRVWYAIADVSAFVAPGGALVDDTWERGQTVYLPDGRVPLHPTVLSEGAASLLPDQSRPAVVWTIDLDADGATTTVRVERAIVRSRAKLGYPAVQADVAAGSLDDPIALLPEIGTLLIERGLARGAINLPIPSQEVEPVDGGWELVLRAPDPVEDFNAQISLLTGMAAAQIMIEGKVGLLRTMPAPTSGAIAKLKAAAGPLGVAWPAGVSAGRVIGAVNGNDPRGAAFLGQAAELMRGAGYAALDGSVPELHEHGGVAAPYAHVTAPLRRLADRYATEACLALFAGTDVPEWVRPGAAEAARRDGGDRPRGQHGRARRGRSGRGRTARGPGRGAVRRRGPRRRRLQPCTRTCAWCSTAQAAQAAAGHGCARRSGRARPLRGPWPGCWRAATSLAHGR